MELENQEDMMNTTAKTGPGEPTMKQKQIIGDIKNKQLGIDTSKNRNSVRIGLAEQLQANYNKTVEPKMEKMVCIREDKNQQHKREFQTKLPDININRSRGVA